MFVRNLLQAGDHVTIVPAGIRITLQYSERGSLESVYVGHPDNQVLHEELLTPLIASLEVPTHLPITRGTSYVYGCLYTGDIFKVEGKLTNTVEAHYVSQYLQNPDKFHFFAGHMQSYAVGMNTPIAIQRWLKTMNFNVLPSYLVPANLNEDNFSVMLNLDSYPFRYPRIMSYILFRNGKFEFVPTNVRQMVVKEVKKYTSYDGYILADVVSHDVGFITTTYADVVNYNIHKGSVILVNDDNVIIDCYNDPSIKKHHDRKLVCEYCGKLISVPEKSKRFTCSDSHCVSVIYNRVNAMLTNLGFDKISVERLHECAEATGNIVSLPDILDLDEYKDLKITVDAPKILRAVVPTSVIPRFSDWTVFCNKCNNSVDSILYYLKNPDKLMLDLELDGAVYRRLYDWLLVPENLFDVVGMIEHPNITVVSTGKKFEGAPIFRGKSIYVTGTFKHGSYEDIRAILASYSAEVYDRFNTAVDCVIVGSMHEGVSGKSVQKAKMMNIPIFEEDEFFQRYDIDTDIATYLD